MGGKERKKVKRQSAKCKVQKSKSKADVACTFDFCLLRFAF
jgi:hypothetical protein